MCFYLVDRFIKYANKNKVFFVRLSANIFFIHTIFMCGPTLIESGRVVLFVSGFLSKTLNGVY